MNLLVTADRNYLPVLRVMLYSLLKTNPKETFSLYLAHSALTEEELRPLLAGLDRSRISLFPILLGTELLRGAPVEKRYPLEMYYRLFAPAFLPKTLDRILYLDPDLVALGPVRPLYELPMQGCWFAAASHVSAPVQMINRLRLGLPQGACYVNSGVLLMDLCALREAQDPRLPLDYIRQNRLRLLLPDQDILNALYYDRILALDPMVYNLSERVLRRRPQNTAWIRGHTVFVHYCGRNKPWRKGYVGSLGLFYREYARQLAAQAE